MRQLFKNKDNRHMGYTHEKLVSNRSRRGGDWQKSRRNTQHIDHNNEHTTRQSGQYTETFSLLYDSLSPDKEIQMGYSSDYVATVATYQNLPSAMPSDRGVVFWIQYLSQYVCILWFPSCAYQINRLCILDQ